MTMLLTLLIGVTLLVIFHRECSVFLQCCAELVGDAFQVSEGPLVKAWAASQEWIRSEVTPSPTCALLGCATLVVVIRLAFTTYSVLRELIPNVFPFGGGDALALTLAISTCFVGLLVHQIKPISFRVVLCFLAMALIVLNSFLAYSGAAVVYNAGVLQHGGVPEEWPFNRDVILPTCMSFFFSAAEFAGFWGGLYLAGSAVARMVTFPFRAALFLLRLIVQWFNKHQALVKLQRIIEAIDAALNKVKVVVTQTACFLWQRFSSENRHSRSLARWDHKKALLAVPFEYKKQQQEFSHQLAQATAKKEFESETQHLDYLGQLREAATTAESQHELAKLQQEAVHKATKCVLDALNTAIADEVAEALPSERRGEHFRERNSALATHSGQTVTKCPQVYERINAANRNNYSPSRFKGE